MLHGVFEPDRLARHVHCTYSLGMPRIPELFAPKSARTKSVPFEFVLDELASLPITTRAMFGSTAIYLDERIVFVLRQKGDSDDGVWVAFESAHEREVLEALPRLTTIDIFGGRVGSWRKLSAHSEQFEDDVLHACSLLKRGDDLLGKVPSKKARPRRSRDELPVAPRKKTPARATKPAPQKRPVAKPIRAKQAPAKKRVARK